MAATPELITFVRLQLQNGFSADDISAQLAIDGWDAQDIQDAFDTVHLPPAHAQEITDITLPLLLSETGITFFKRLWVILVLIIITAVCFAGYYLIPTYATQLFLQAFKKTNPWKDIVTTGSGAGFLLVLTLIFQGWGPMALLYATINRGRRANPFQALGKTFGKMTRYLTVWFMQLLISGSVLFLFIIGLLLVGSRLGVHDTQSTAVLSSQEYGILGVSFFICLLLLIVVFTWFSFGIPILVDENERPLNALLKSKRYVSTHFLDILRLSIPKAILVLLLFSLPFFAFLKTPNKDILLISLASIGLFLIVLHALYTGILYDYLKGIVDLDTYKPTIGEKLRMMLFIFLGLTLPFVIVYILYVYYSPLFFALLSSNPTK